MIKVILLESRLVPIMVCDICDRPITEVMQAVAVNSRMRNMEEREQNRVFHTHKGNCHNAAEALFGTPAGWEELSTHLYYLCFNLGLTSEWFQERDKRFEKFGL